MEARPMAGFLFYKWKPARGGGLVVLYECPPEGAGLLCYMNARPRGRACCAINESPPEGAGLLCYK